MAKKSKVGAVANSVSPETAASHVDEAIEKPCNAIENISGNMETAESPANEASLIPICSLDPNTGNLCLENIAMTPQLIESAEEFFVEFAKKYVQKPESAAALLCDTLWDIRVHGLVEESHANMTNDKIVSDAYKLINAGMCLIHDFDKYHDFANETVKEIMDDHIPELPQVLAQSELRLLNENKN